MRPAAGVCGVLAGLVVALSAGRQEPLVVRTDAGVLRGVEVRGARRAEMRAFLGIPYAVPPVGDLRWKPPVPARWDGVFDATALGPPCAQSTPRWPSEEGCLTLEVYAPPQPSGTASPVLFYIHGGGLVEGRTGGSADPSLLVGQGLVVVMVNYRLGILGFLAHAALDRESPARVSGNYGLLDQLLALKWVQRNIAAFGGDPTRVTLMGQSSGGISERVLMASPLATGLFAGAIVESGSRREAVTTAESEAQGRLLVARAGCPDQQFACMRRLPVATLLAVQGGYNDPVIDGRLIPGPVRTAFAGGAFGRVPILEGSNHDDGRLEFALKEWAGSPPLTASDYESVVKRMRARPYSPSDLSKILARYPLRAYPNPTLAAAAALTDGGYACPAWQSVRSASKFVPVFQYEFNAESFPPPRGAPSSPSLSFPLGAAHSMELTYLLPMPAPPGVPPSPEQSALATGLIEAFATFARTGVPGPDWTPYSAAADQVRVFSWAAPRGAVETTFAADHQCAFWAGIS